MKLQTKALYNLLRLNFEKDSSIACEKWQVEDLRTMPTDALFQRLREKGITLDNESLKSYAEKTDSPEELAELLAADSAQFDPIYLLLFELWRRCFPERRTLSIFCDELDHLISDYDAGRLASDEPIQDALANLAEILEENADANIQKHQIFDTADSYSAHDLREFIIDFISDVIDKNAAYAAELIEDFAPFSPESAWFDFLRARLTALTDSIAANAMIVSILKEKELAADLLFEILEFQVGYGEKPIFLATVKKILGHLETEEDFKDLLTLSAEYFRRRDREDLEKAVQTLLSKRKTAGSISPTDPDVKAFAKLLPT